MRKADRLIPGLVVLAAMASGCARGGAGTSAAWQGLGKPVYVPEVETTCTPPEGWRMEYRKDEGAIGHVVWISPSGATAYGVGHFAMPLPVGPELASRGFVRRMRQEEGEVVVPLRRRDDELGGVRFVAEGTEHILRVNLVTRGWRGWATYAGTKRDRPINAAELDLAQRARENTRMGQRVAGAALPATQPATTRDSP